MRKMITSICLLVATLSVQAASLKGIRIESAGQSIVVCIDGEQVCTATTSCFIANLPAGYYKVEVYAAIPGRRGDATVRRGDTRVRRGGLLYNERVRYNARGIHDIAVGARADVRPGDRTDRYDDKTDRYDDRTAYPDREVYDVMNDANFGRFYQSVKSAPFDSERRGMIETAVVTSWFTSDQCLQLTKLCPFDNDRMKIMKTLYPKVVDKSNFFIVIEALTFSNNKNEMGEFVKRWHER